MSQIIRYIFRRGLDVKPSTGVLESNVTITCGSSEVIGTLVWQGFLYSVSNGSSEVTGTLSSYVGIDGATVGYSEVIGTLTANSDSYGVSDPSSEVTGTLTANGYIYTNIIITCGSSEVIGMLTSDILIEAVTNGSSTVIGTLINASVYNVNLIGVIINNPSDAGLQAYTNNWYNSDIGIWFFRADTVLTVPQPTMYELLSFLSTDPAIPEIGSKVFTKSWYSVKDPTGKILFNPLSGHKFHTLITDTLYTSGQLTDIINNMVEVSDYNIEGPPGVQFYNGVFEWWYYTDFRDTYIYIIHDFRSNRSDIEGIINGISIVTSGTLTGTGYILGESNGITEVLPDLTAFNLFFGNVADYHPTRTSLIHEISYSGNLTAGYNHLNPKVKRWANEVFHGPWNNVNEAAMQLISPITLPFGGPWTFDGSDAVSAPVTYLIDIDGVVKVFGQGAFRSNASFERMHLPGCTHLAGPSGYFTLINNPNLKGHLLFPEVTGLQGNMNHVFNNCPSITKLYFPKLERIYLQLSSRQNFTNMSGLQRVYMPKCIAFRQYLDTNYRIFRNLPAGTIMYLNPLLETNGDGGGRVREVIYWEDTRGAEIRYVTDFTPPNTPTSISATNITSTSFDIIINDLEPLPAGGFYEVWADDGVQMWMMFTSHQEVLASGDTVSNLKTGVTYKVKMRKADYFMNYSEFTDLILVTMLGSSAIIYNLSSVSGTLTSSTSIGILIGVSNGYSVVQVNANQISFIYSVILNESYFKDVELIALGNFEGIINNSSDLFGSTSSRNNVLGVITTSSNLTGVLFFYSSTDVLGVISTSTTITGLISSINNISGVITTSSNITAPIFYYEINNILGVVETSSNITALITANTINPISSSINTSSTVEGVLSLYSGLLYPATVNPNNIDWSLEPYSFPNQNNPAPSYLVPFNDPVTGAIITRVGDETAFGQSGSVTQHNYSSKAVWNCTGTLMMLSWGIGGARILNAGNYTVDHTVNIPGAECWSSINPNKIYGVQNGNEFVSMNATTGVRTVLHTFPGYTQIDIGYGEGRIDQQDKYVALLATGGGTRLITYDIELDIVIADIVLPAGNLDFASISDSGQYVFVSWNDDGNGVNQGFKRYNVDLTGLTHLYDYTGHGDCGIDQEGNEVFVQFRSSNISLGVTQRYLEMIRLDNGQVTGLYFDSDNPSPRGVWGGHVSCRNIERPGWAYISEGYASDDVMANEIFAVKLSTTENLVERYGKHHSNRLIGYNHQAHACVNRNGTQIIFKSNWNNIVHKTYSHAPSYVLKWPQV